MFICFLFVCLFIDLLVFCFNHRRIPTGSFPQNFVKIQLDLAEILRISKLDWRDGGEEGKGRRREGILLCNGLIASLWARLKFFFYFFRSKIFFERILCPKIS